MYFTYFRWAIIPLDTYIRTSKYHTVCFTPEKYLVAKLLWKTQKTLTSACPEPKWIWIVKVKKKKSETPEEEKRLFKYVFKNKVLPIL